MNLIFRYFNLKGLNLFIIVTLLNMLIIWLSKYALINETVFYNTYSEQLTYDRSMILFGRMKDIAWISYAFAPVILFVKFTLVSLVLYTGIVLCNLQERISLGSVFRVVIASEIIFVIAGVLNFSGFICLPGIMISMIWDFSILFL